MCMWYSSRRGWESGHAGPRSLTTRPTTCVCVCSSRNKGRRPHRAPTYIRAIMEAGHQGSCVCCEPRTLPRCLLRDEHAPARREREAPPMQGQGQCYIAPCPMRPPPLSGETLDRRDTPFLHSRGQVTRASALARCHRVGPRRRLRPRRPWRPWRLPRLLPSPARPP